MSKYSLSQLEKVLSALSESGRLRILNALKYRPLAVCEIREIIGLSFSTVSKHLAILKEAGLIDYEKEGKWVHYRLNLEPRSDLARLVFGLLEMVDGDDRLRLDLVMARRVNKNLICGIKPGPKEKKIFTRRNKS